MEHNGSNGQSLDSVVEKIRKLMNLANRPGTEGEAQAAAGKVQELLATYNLQLSDIDLTPNTTSAARSQDGKRTKEKYHKAAMFAYQRQLWKAVSEANYCWYSADPVYKVMPNGHTQRTTYHHYIVGREVNVVSAKLMGDYLEETINRLCPYRPGRDSSKSWISWKEGCTSRLVDRLWDKRREMERENEAEMKKRSAGGPCTAITLVGMAERESDENYRFMHGEEAYQRLLLNRHNYNTCQCDNCKDRKARMEAWEKRNQKPETEAEKKARERRSEQYWQRYEREQARMWAKKDLAAYRDGQQKANDINLNTQINTSSATTRKEVSE